MRVVSLFSGRLINPSAGYVPSNTISKTVIGKVKSTSLRCGTYAIFFLQYVSGLSANVTCPCSRGISPIIPFNKVDLPAPFGPTIPVSFPDAI